MKNKEKKALFIFVIFIFAYFGGMVMGVISGKCLGNFWETVISSCFFIAYFIGFFIGHYNNKKQ